MFMQTSQLPVTCLVILLHTYYYIVHYGVMKVGWVLLVLVQLFLNMLRRCMRWASYALLISYSP